MTAIEKDIVNASIVLFENLSFSAKTELIERLKEALKVKKETSKNGLEMSFGAWESDKSPEEIIKEINDDLRFKNREIKL